MSKVKFIKSIITEYGIDWIFNRTLYGAKLKLMNVIPITEKFYEKKTVYPIRTDIFDIDVNSLDSFIKQLDESEKKLLLNTADKACKGSICGFSSIYLNYGEMIDWQLNPLTSKRCNEKMSWYRIPDFDAERGDIKVICEASRFSHFITLSRAYILTKDFKYYKAFSNQLQDWLNKNPYGRGANFKCSQECSLRMVNGLLAYTIFNGFGVTTDKDKNNIKDLIDRCYRKILSNFFYAYKCIKNNHTISELMGMIVGAWCCRDETRLDKAYLLLNKVINEQFTEDGGYSQFSFNYQRLALQDIECVLSISRKTGRTLNKVSKNKIKNAAFLMYQCQDENGDMPNYGSNDGALVFPLTNCGYRDYRPVINTSYALTTGKQLYREGIHQEELLWFSGGKRLADFDIDIKNRVSSQFAKSGLFTIRTPNSWSMIVANSFHSRPSHMDQNHFDLWINDINVLCDAGTYSYASELGKKLVSNASHNTVLVDDRQQMNSHGPFLIYDWTKRILGYCDSHSFTGKIVSVNGYSHKRSIQYTGSTYKIIDNVDKDFVVLFHTPCDISIENNIAYLSNNGIVLCKIDCSGSFEIQSSERSLYYLKKEVTSCLAIKGTAGNNIITKIQVVEGEI